MKTELRENIEHSSLIMYSKGIPLFHCHINNNQRRKKSFYFKFFWQFFASELFHQHEKSERSSLIQIFLILLIFMAMSFISNVLSR